MEPQQRVTVTPFGDHVVSEDRGSLMGNRGIIHNEDGNLTKRRWAHKNWVTCLKRFKGRKRELYSPGIYTELFFLDEATALAAGHRPCCECRREDFHRFREAWLKGNPDSGFDSDVSMATIERNIHKERTDKTPVKARLSSLPEGVMVELSDRPGQAWLYWGKTLYLWAVSGYTETIPAADQTDVRILTPYSIVSAISAGYKPTVAL